MGSHQSHEKVEQGGSGFSTPRAGSRRGTVTRTGSGADLPAQEKPQHTSMVPVEKLTKLLVQRSQKEDGINGITEKSFTKYIFPLYPELAHHCFWHMHRCSKSKNKHIPSSAFKVQCERILGMLDDNLIIDTYVNMFSSEEDEGTMTPEGFRTLLYISYKISMDHYPEGPQTCLMINKTLSAVVDGCFNNKESHSVGFVVRWLQEHCRRVLLPVHRYSVHMIATRHRDIETLVEQEGSGIELGTPVLERGLNRRLPASAAWLLAAAIHPLYSKPHTNLMDHDISAGGVLSSQWVSRLLCATPSHWTPLYSSREHGLGANRFLHHTLAYRGPTIVLVQAAECTVVVASTVEWRESHQYWGAPESVLLQLFPTFSIVEQAPKLIYLNLSVRGYPKGLRAGSDPRKPLLDINEGFDHFQFKGAPYLLEAIEVWGCGDTASREAQLDVKKWQVKEAERQRQIKISAADWLDHPDRYLLELAGRPQYNNSSK